MVVIGGNKQKCPACFGSGVQKNNEGLRVLCPVCDGTGRTRLPKDGDNDVLFRETSNTHFTTDENAVNKGHKIIG